MSDPDPPKADIRDVARAAGVSMATVSRVFNHPGLVHPATRKRVEAAVRELGYVRNRAAQTIHGMRSASIGIVVPTIDHAIFAELVQSFADGLEEEGFTMLLGSHGYDLEREYRLVRKFLEHRVDGVALIGLEHGADLVALIERQKTPMLTLWNWREGGALPCIGVDNREAGRIAAAHLLSLGHRDIALVFPPLEGNDRAGGRFEGACAALAEAGAAPANGRMLTARYTTREASAEVARLIARAPRPTAILCGNDILAQGAIFALQQAGLVPGRDVSVIGIGDFRWSADMVPPLTTVRLPARRIGARAAEVLSVAIREAAPTMESVRYPCRLMVRASCGPPPG